MFEQRGSDLSPHLRGGLTEVEPHAQTRDVYTHCEHLRHLPLWHRSSQK